MMMLRYFGAWLALVGCTASSEVSGASPTWCFQEQETGHRAALGNHGWKPVVPERLESARELLREATVIAISRKDAERFSRTSFAAFPRYYLVRGSVTTPRRNATLASAYKYAKSVKYQLLYSSDDSTLAVFSSQSIEDERINHNMAFVLGSSVDISKVYVGCWITD